MMIKKMWKKLTAVMVATMLMISMLLVPASARGPVNSKNNVVVLKTTWAYEITAKKVTKKTRIKKGQVFRVKKMWQSVTYKVGKKTYKGYVDKIKKGVYVRKSPGGKRLVKITNKNKCRVTDKWAQVTVNGKTRFIIKGDLKYPTSPFNNSDYFFVKKIVRDNTQTAGSSYRVWVTDFWGDTYMVSPWGYNKV